MTKTQSTAKAMKHPMQAGAVSQTVAGKSGSGPGVALANPPVATPATPSKLLEPDTNLSVAGEEDPGAALDSPADAANPTR